MDKALTLEIVRGEFGDRAATLGAVAFAVDQVGGPRLSQDS